MTRSLTSFHLRAQRKRPLRGIPYLGAAVAILQVREGDRLSHTEIGGGVEGHALERAPRFAQPYATGAERNACVHRRRRLTVCVTGSRYQARPADTFIPAGHASGARGSRLTRFNSGSTTAATACFKGLSLSQQHLPSSPQDCNPCGLAESQKAIIGHFETLSLRNHSYAQGSSECEPNCSAAEISRAA